MCSIYDVVRIDHFRGFAGYYAIPYGNKTAEADAGVPAPAMHCLPLSRKSSVSHASLPRIWLLTDDVNALLRKCGYPGMKVLEFGLTAATAADYRPHGVPR